MIRLKEFGVNNKAVVKIAYKDSKNK